MDTSYELEVLEVEVEHNNQEEEEDNKKEVIH